jgi:hypothetical protein
MVSVSVFAKQAASLEAAHASMEAGMMQPQHRLSRPMMPMRLRRTGARPLTFVGTEICSATSHAIGPSLWCEINLHATDQDRFVADIRMFFKSENIADVFTVHEADSIDEAVSILEAFDPASHLVVDLAVGNLEVPAIEIALKAAELRLRLEEARGQYRDLLGEVLYDLEAA